MKASKYNTFFFYEGKQIGYNALSNDFIILIPELHDLFNAAVNEDAIEDLHAIHPKFYDHLIEKGFIRDRGIDELQEVKDMVRKVDMENESTYQLTINPTMNCNFKCWYCYETHIKESKMDIETIGSVTKLIENIVLQKPDLKYFIISWFGGEPLLYFDSTVKPILENAKAILEPRGIVLSSGFTTNGLLINQKKLDICKNLGVRDFQITLDGHRERHNVVRFISKERGSYDEIIENIKLSLRNGFYVSVRLNISKETLNNDLNNIMFDFSDVEEDLRPHLFFSFHEVWQNEKDLGRDIQEVVKFYRSEGFQTDFKGNWDFVRSSCYADKKNHATVNYNGDVFKCTARDFETPNREGFLNTDGVIEWNERYETRMTAKFQNKPCLTCRILPICNGGCSQQAVEHLGRDYCVNGFDENKKTDLVKNKFFYTIS